MAERLIDNDDVQELREDVDDLTAFSKLFTHSIINWYLIEMKIQILSKSIGNFNLSSVEFLTYLLYFTSLWSTGSDYFVISLPDANLWKEKGYGYYYAVNMIRLRAYPYPTVNPRFSLLILG